MARAEVVWEEHPGAWRGELAKIEDTSRSGACIRMSVPISVGSKLKIKWQREEFSGIAKYCRRDEGDYVLGIQREVPESETVPRRSPQHGVINLPVPSTINVQGASPKQEKNEQELPKTTPEPAHATIAVKTIASQVAVEIVANVQETSEDLEKNMGDSPATHPENAPGPIAPKAVALVAEAATEEANESAAENKRAPVVVASPAHQLQSDTNLRHEPHAHEPSQGQERTIVLNKLLHLGSVREKQTSPHGSMNDAKALIKTPEVRTPRANQSSPAARTTGLPPNQDNLLSLQDIYLAVGIVSSRLGYNIDTVSRMLDSDHMSGMTSEIKRASVLTALEAAGIPVIELLQDGAKRLDALNTYESAERKRFEEYEARKSQESAQIQSEIERMTAHCLERIKHNLSEVTLAKDVFLNWQTIKQKESQRISDAVALFSKPSAVEQAADGKPMLQATGTDSKH
jgi:hypothetical protein